MAINLAIINALKIKTKKMKNLRKQKRMKMKILKFKGNATIEAGKGI